MFHKHNDTPWINPYQILCFRLCFKGDCNAVLAFWRMCCSWQNEATVLMLVADSEASATMPECAAAVSPEKPLADLAWINPPMKWQGITAHATSPIRQLTRMLTAVAIKIEETHCTMTAIRSEIMVLTVDVSFMILEVSDPTLFSGLSNHASSLLSTAAECKSHNYLLAKRF